MPGGEERAVATPTSARNAPTRYRAGTHLFCPTIESPPGLFWLGSEIPLFASRCGMTMVPSVARLKAETCELGGGRAVGTHVATSLTRVGRWGSGGTDFATSLTRVGRPPPITHERGLTGHVQRLVHLGEINMGRILGEGKGAGGELGRK